MQTGNITIGLTGNANTLWFRSKEKEAMAAA
jgi:hypothetical protein